MPRRASLIAFRAGGALLAFGLFVALTHELRERDVDAIDRAMLVWLAAARRSWLNAVAVDLTALGSAAVLTLVATFAALFLLARRHRASTVQLIVASLGGGLLTSVTKQLIERERPSIVPRLVEVVGYSYPSGHSLSSTATYLTMAMIGLRHVESRAARVTVLAAGLVVTSAIAISRVYLGVHYPSDVASGMCLGAGWALLVEAATLASSP